MCTSLQCVLEKNAQSFTRGKFETACRKMEIFELSYLGGKQRIFNSIVQTLPFLVLSNNFSTFLAKTAWLWLMVAKFWCIELCIFFSGTPCIFMCSVSQVCYVVNIICECQWCIPYFVKGSKYPTLPSSPFLSFLSFLFFPHYLLSLFFLFHPFTTGLGQSTSWMWSRGVKWFSAFWWPFSFYFHNIVSGPTMRNRQPASLRSSDLLLLTYTANKLITHLLLRHCWQQRV